MTTGFEKNDFSPVPGPAEEVDVPTSTDSSTSTLPVASNSDFRSAFSSVIYFLYVTQPLAEATRYHPLNSRLFKQFQNRFLSIAFNVDKIIVEQDNNTSLFPYSGLP